MLKTPIFLALLMAGCPKTTVTTGGSSDETESAQGEQGIPSATVQEKPLCTRSGQIDCLANSKFPAAAVLHDDTAVPNLTSEQFHQLLASSTTFEFWDAEGTRHTAQGSSLFVPENIKQGVSLLGISGSLTAAALLCQHSSQASCLADSACQWSSGACSVDPWNIRSGKAIAGVTGQFPNNCWLTPSACWVDLTADGFCDSSSDDCLMKDRVSGLMWSESAPSPGAAPGTSLQIVDWNQAVSFCDSLNFGTYNDWRLPGSHEMQLAFVHGIRSLGYRGGASRTNGTLDNNNAFLGDVDGQFGNPFNMGFWTATTSSDPSVAVYIDFDAGPYIIPYARGNGAQYLCVRP